MSDQKKAKPIYKRVLLKLSGEALMGHDQFGINRDTLNYMVGEIKSILDIGVQVGIVVGGGNISAALLWVRTAWTVRPVTTWACSPP